jgi:hypothetical protein
MSAKNKAKNVVKKTEEDLSKVEKDVAKGGRAVGSKLKNLKKKV